MSDIIKRIDEMIYSLDKEGPEGWNASPIEVLQDAKREIETLRADVVLLKNIGPSFREIKQSIKEQPNGLLPAEVDWQKLPLSIRQRWWEETNFGTKAPSDAFMQEIKNAASL